LKDSDNRNLEIGLLQQMWEILVAASAPKYGASYGSIQRFLFAIEGLLP
jgi:hypothetical protein